MSPLYIRASGSRDALFVQQFLCRVPSLHSTATYGRSQLPSGCLRCVEGPRSPSFRLIGFSPDVIRRRCRQTAVLGLWRLSTGGPPHGVTGLRRPRPAGRVWAINTARHWTTTGRRPISNWIQRRSSYWVRQQTEGHIYNSLSGHRRN